MTIKEKILKIMSLALEINPPEIKDIGKKKTAVFVYWYPHCNNLTVAIHFNGWNPCNGEDERFDATIRSKNGDEELDVIIKKLEEIKESEGKA